MFLLTLFHTNKRNVRVDHPKNIVFLKKRVMKKYRSAPFDTTIKYVTVKIYNWFNGIQRRLSEVTWTFILSKHMFSFIYATVTTMLLYFLIFMS